MLQETTESDFRDRLSMYEDMVSTIPVGVFRFTMRATGEWQFDFVNSRFCDLTGLNREDVPNNYENAFRIIHPDDFPEFISLIESVEKNPAPFTWVGRIIVNGETRWMRVESTPTVMDNGDIGWSGYITDITDRKKAEDAVRRSEELFHGIFESHAAVMLLIEPATGKIIDANIAAERFYGYAGSKLRSMYIQEINILPPDEVAIERNFALSQRRSHFIFPHRLADGAVRTVEVHSSPIERHGEPMLFSIIHDITDRKEAEDALRESQENLRSLFETIDDIIVVSDIDGKIMYFNPAVSQKLGYPTDELKTMHILDLNPKSQRQEAERILSEIYKGDRSTCPLPLEKKDGTLIPTETRVWLGKWSGVDSIFAICKDISKEQEALQKFNKFFELNPTPMAVSGLPDRKFIDVNESWLTTLGFSKNEVIGKTSAELGLWVNPEKQQELAKRIQKQDTDRDIELQIRKKDGGILEGLFFGTVIDSQGEKFLLTVMLDVTKRKASEAFLKQSEAKFRTFVDFTYDWEYWVNADCSIEYTSPSCERITGSPAVDFINNPDMLDSIVHPEDREKWLCHSQGITSASGSQHVDFRIVHRNGQIVWIAHSCQTVFGADGAWMGRRASNRDITRRINAENEVYEHLSMIEGILANAGEGLCVCHNIDEYPFVRFTHWNERMTKITGYSMDEINRLGWYQSMYPDPELQNRAIERMSRMRIGDDLHGEEWLITTKERHETPVLISTSVLTDAKGSNHALAVIHDITDRKKLEEERLQIERKLLHAQRLESLGTMAGGIAHDFNNLLQVVLGNLDLALDDIPPDSKARASILNAIKASERSAELSGQMLVYSGSAIYLPKEIYLDDLLNKTKSLLQSTISGNVALDFDTCKMLPPIKGEADQIQRLTCALVVNASEAIGANAGAVTLRTGVMNCDEAYLSHSRLEKKPEAGQFVFLEVADNGCGMDAETQLKLFDPFFSTKFWGRGLGMAEVLGIVKGHHGAIMVDSEVGKGTTIRVLFSAPQQVLASTVHPMEAVETQPAVTGSSASRKTILVVDDEELVRGLLIRRLEALGYDTISASNGDEGVCIFRERLNEIDLVLLDFAMPRMNGVEAYAELIRIKPDVKVILSSGYTEDVVMESFPGQRPAGVLHKPYKMEELKGELDRLLGTTG